MGSRSSDRLAAHRSCHHGRPGTAGTALPGSTYTGFLEVCNDLENLFPLLPTVRIESTEHTKCVPISCLCRRTFWS